MKYVAIEGSSYVGKTTVVNEFAREGFGVIPEYDTFGPFKPLGESYESLKEAALDIVGREKKRTRLLGKLASQSIVVADRSIFSLVTYEDMMIYTADSEATRQLRNDIRSFIIDTLHNELEEGSITPPDAIVTLKIDYKEAFESRVAHRGITPIRHLSSFAVQQLIANRVYQYSTLTLGQQSSIIIDVSYDSEASAFNRIKDSLGTLSPPTTLINIKTIEGLDYDDTHATAAEA